MREEITGTDFKWFIATHFNTIHPAMNKNTASTFHEDSTNKWTITIICILFNIFALILHNKNNGHIFNPGIVIFNSIKSSENHHDLTTSSPRKVTENINKATCRPDPSPELIKYNFNIQRPWNLTETLYSELLNNASKDYKVIKNTTRSFSIMQPRKFSHDAIKSADGGL